MGKMAAVLKSVTRETLKKLDLAIVRQSDLKKLTEDRDAAAGKVTRFLEVVLGPTDERAGLLLKTMENSRAQLRQDLFVLSELGFKRKGFFVEFGATNGIDLSNTFLLETRFNWNGILAEPARCWYDSLRTNRRGPIETCCVWSESNSTVTFNEAEVAELSTVATVKSAEYFDRSRKKGSTYDVHTISLNDLLAKYDAPKEIDYLSIDTEGSEFDVLRNFDFDRYTIKVITCEHNFTPTRESVNELLTSHGYVRKFEELSDFDDWYTKA